MSHGEKIGKFIFLEVNMPTIQDVIKNYSKKLIEQESLLVNSAVAGVISNELRYMKSLPHKIYITLAPVSSVSNNWTITILASSTPHSGSVETPLNSTDICKVLIDAGGRMVESTNPNEYQFVFSLFPTDY